MTITAPRGFSGIVAVPKSISSIVVTVGGLAIFLMVGSFLAISYPASSSLKGYFKEESVQQEGGGAAQKGGHFGSRFVVSRRDWPGSGKQDIVITREPSDGYGEMTGDVIEEPSSGSTEETKGVENASENKQSEAHEVTPGEIGEELKTMDSSKDGASDAKEETSEVDGSSSGKENVDGSEVEGDGKSGSENATLEVRVAKASGSDGGMQVPSPLSESKRRNKSAGSRDCDLYQGRWIYDPSAPLYTNNSCPVITQMQNCQGNGRPDKDYENYRWKPHQCDLPRFNPRKFLEMMKGKTIAFVGDSVSRNQMESLICILWQEETPKNRGNRRMHRWYFRSTSTMIVRIWSSWLVHIDTEPFQFAPKGITKVFLDVPDETFMGHLPTFDVLVLSSGHWFAKQSAYVQNNNIVGGQLWWPGDAGKMKINSVEAFAISVETIMTAIASNPNFTGLTILRTYSPDHYEGGAWNTGGSCTGKQRPASEVVRNGFTDSMHEKQITGYNRAINGLSNGHNKIRLMDITGAFEYRTDGHPGPYRSPDPNKKTKRGPHGEPPPQDCLHWCMPGPVDTWNEILLEVIRREFERELG